MHSTDYFNRTYSKLLNMGCNPPFSHIFGMHHLLLGLPHLSCSSNTELLGVLWILYNVHTSAPLFMLFSLPRISFFSAPLYKTQNIQDTQSLPILRLRDLSINPPRFNGISLVVQWLKLWVSNAQGVGSILERELRSYMPHSQK